jgi:fluoroquinolone resistance protein
MSLTEPEREDYEDDYFEKYTLDSEDMTNKVFQDCHFKSCRFSYCDFSYSVFRNCTFENCEFTVIKVISAGFSNCEFTECRLQGINFAECNGYQFYSDFKETIIGHCFFGEMDLKERSFNKCRFKNTEFTKTNLKKSDFKEVDFEETIFSDCNLEKADFTRARGYTIHPMENRMKGAIFSYPDVITLLSPLGIVIKES